MKTLRLLICVAAIGGFSNIPNPVFAQGTTAFTYQGQLRDGGTNANGAYTMIFKLYDASVGGNQINGAVTNSPTLANGLFTVNLDFGSNAFNAFARWLDITVQSGGDTQTLSPRVQVLPTPYAQFAHTAGSFADITSTTVNSNLVSSDNWQGGTVLRNDLTHSFAFSDNGVNQMILGANGQGAFFTSNVFCGGTFYGGGGGLSSLIPNISVFTNGGIFAVPTNGTKIMVEIWGAGGGGGNGYFDGTNYWRGGGGGAGGYAWNVFTVNPGASYAITIGVSGAGQSGTITSFSNLLSATGGSAGGNASAVSDGAGGAGGIGSGSLINVKGSSGGSSGGGTVWRGGLGGNVAGVLGGNGSKPGGPGGGGGGGSGFGTGAPGNDGRVIVYY